MTRNILLTSPDALENDKPLRYYSFPNTDGRGFCEALQSMEASTRYLLSCFPFDEILVIGRENQSDGAEDEKPVLLKDAGALYGADPNTLSAFNLYRSRIAQFIDGLSLEQQEAEELLPEEERAKLISFIEGFAKRCSKQINILFDELSSSFPLYEQFKDELSDALPEIRDHSLPVMKWIKNYLYTQLKSSAKLEIFPGNEKVRARYVPVAMLESRDYWINNVLNINQDVLDGNDEINIYIALGTSPAIDEHLISNILSLLIYVPGSKVRLRKTYKVSEPSWILSGKIEDSTAITRSTDLASAARAFLNYSKTDLLMDFWGNSGEKNERISRLIYAAQHVDMGISMCNLLEVKEGIRQLRKLLLEDRPWVEDGDYGYLFGLIAGCITADYGPLLESDESISFFELIKWAYRHQLAQQVLTLIESHAPENRSTAVSSTTATTKRTCPR